MPTKKPRLQTIVEEEIYMKVQSLKTIEKRKSESDMVKVMIETYIENYETKNGEIKIECE